MPKVCQYNGSNLVVNIHYTFDLTNMKKELTMMFCWRRYIDCEYLFFRTDCRTYKSNFYDLFHKKHSSSKNPVLRRPGENRKSINSCNLCESAPTGPNFSGSGGITISHHLSFTLFFSLTVQLLPAGWMVGTHIRCRPLG